MHETIVPRPEPEKMNAMGAMKIEVKTVGRRQSRAMTRNSRKDAKKSSRRQTT
jgi:hypothetical protein